MELSFGSESDELPAGTPVGEYRIERTIATGGMGTVYAAVHPIIGKRAAIKVISSLLSRDPDAVERFVLEARSVNAIGDPNIVDIFGFGTLADGRLYLVMEWLVGETLAARCRVETPTIPEVIHIVSTVARTLETVHQCGFIHRDLKPDNVFLCRRRAVTRVAWPYDVVLLDFGIAKLVAGGDGRREHTCAGMVIGTPRYLSPEQARAAPVDASTDVYSLGVVAYELLVGAPPFAEGNPFEIMDRHIHEAPVPPRALRREIPPALDDLVMRMLAKQPGARPRLAECRRRLGAALDPATTMELHLVVPTAPAAPAPSAPAVFTPPPGELAAPATGPRIMLVMALGAVVVLAAVLLGAALLRDPTSPRKAAGLPPAVSEPAAVPPVDAAPATAIAPDEEAAAKKSPPRRRRPRRVEPRGPIHLR